MLIVFSKKSCACSLCWFLLGIIPGLRLQQPVTSTQSVRLGPTLTSDTRGRQVCLSADTPVRRQPATRL